MMTNVAYADSCNWDDDPPCLTIYPNINNSNALGDKITPTYWDVPDDIAFKNLDRDQKKSMFNHYCLPYQHQ